MKNQITILSSFCLMFIFSSCSEDTCVQSEWVGTWNLVGERECESGSTTHFANDSFELEAGGSTDMIKIQSSDFQLDENGCTLNVEDITLRISGNELTSDYNDGCTFKYTRG